MPKPMKIESNALLVAAVTLGLVGCAAPSTKLQDSSGRVVTCSSSGFGVLGTTAALLSHSGCVEKAQATGFRAVTEGSVAPKPSPDAAKVGIALPDGWERKVLTEAMASGGGSVFATNSSMDAGVLLSVARRKDVADLMAFVSAKRAEQEARVLNPQSTEVLREEINGRLVFRFEVSGYLRGGLKVTYFYAITEGVEQLAVVNAWTSAINVPKNRLALEALAEKVTGLL